MEYYNQEFIENISIYYELKKEGDGNEKLQIQKRRRQDRLLSDIQYGANVKRDKRKG